MRRNQKEKLKEGSECTVPIRVRGNQNERGKEVLNVLFPYE